MPSKQAENAILHLLDMEGGYVDHPLDNGGPTKYGITNKTLSDYRSSAYGGRPATSEDVRLLLKTEASEIYYRNYWLPNRLQELPENVAAFMLDQIVNRGPKAAVETLQTVLTSRHGFVLKIDGVLGRQTISAISEVVTLPENERRLILNLVREAQRRYIGIVLHNPSQAVFLQGWINRTWALFDWLVK